MPQRHPKAVPGQFYHVFNRGALRFALFLDEYFYRVFLDLMTIYSQQFDITIAATCLMPNHFHLLVRIGEKGDLPKFMQMLCGIYSKKVNLYYKRSGTIFEGRYHSKLVDNDSYFMQLSRYIHLNPVHAGLIEDPAEWKYSNFAECIEIRNDITASHTIITDHFGGVKAYSEFVLNNVYSLGIKNKELLHDLSGLHLL